jgi:cytochrome c peroxidase
MITKAKRISAGLLAGLLLATSGSVWARGRKGGGAAGALDDFDLFLLQQVTTGLPANLVQGYELSGSLPGDATSGVGGTIQFNGQPQMIISQSGQMVTLLPDTSGGGSGGSGRAGFARVVGPDGLPPMLSLKSVAVPPIPGLGNFIRDRQAAILLGKALFWDLQAGSDGNACASCHYHAGADSRLKNQINPAGDGRFQPTATGSGGPNTTLKPGDFPFHRLLDPLDRNSTVTYDSNDVIGSQGSIGGVLKSIRADGTETCGARPAGPDSFEVNSTLTRRVTGRNAPTTINAAFNYRNFWDGRANNSFNGVNPFGPRDTNARVLEASADGSSHWTAIDLPNASLASQATGPALSDFEMSCAKRTFKDLGRKLLALRPLGSQEVHPQDSVLGAHRHPSGHGLKESYADLIRAAIDPRWWSATGKTDGYTQMETNFSLYWGLAVMMYEQTLISDEAPFDKFVGSPGVPADPKALSLQELRGLVLFRGKGQCVSCHKGAEFTGAATALQRDGAEGVLVESMFLPSGGLAVYDNGFYNIGVRPTVEDRGVGGFDPFGNPLSFTRTWFEQLRARPVADPVWVDSCLFSIFFDASACWIGPGPDTTRIVADGAFKTPTLRNVALTQPYFHNGSQFSLEQVVAFYNRGGDRRGPDDNDSTGFVAADAMNGGTSNLHPAVKPLGLTAAEQADLVAFLRNALTDPRVACEQAPFDHPALPLHDGHVGDQSAVRDRNHDGIADDAFIALPAVGAAGLAKERCLRNDDGSVLAGLVLPTPTATTPRP